MSYRVHPDGSVSCDTVDEAMNYADALAKKRPPPARRALTAPQPSGAFEHALREICDELQSPPHDGSGPKPIALQDVMYAMAMRVYIGEPARESEQGIHYNTLLGYMKMPGMTDVIRDAYRRAQGRVAEPMELTLQFGPYMSKGGVARRNEEELRHLCQAPAGERHRRQEARGEPRGGPAAGDGQGPQVRVLPRGEPRRAGVRDLLPVPHTRGGRPH